MYVRVSQARTNSWPRPRMRSWIFAMLSWGGIGEADKVSMTTGTPEGPAVLADQLKRRGAQATSPVT